MLGEMHLLMSCIFKPLNCCSCAEQPNAFRCSSKFKFCFCDCHHRAIIDFMVASKKCKVTEKKSQDSCWCLTWWAGGRFCLTFEASIFPEKLGWILNSMPFGVFNFGGSAERACIFRKKRNSCCSINSIDCFPTLVSHLIWICCTLPLKT